MLPSNSWALASWVSRFHSARTPSHSVFFPGLFSWPSRVTSGYYLLEASSGFLVPGLFSAKGVAMRSWGRATENHRSIHVGYLNRILLLPSIWISLVNFFLFFLVSGIYESDEQNCILMTLLELQMIQVNAYIHSLYMYEHNILSRGLLILNVFLLNFSQFS